MHRTCTQPNNNSPFHNRLRRLTYGLAACIVLVTLGGCSILYRPFLKQEGDNYLDVLSRLGWDPTIEDFSEVPFDLFYGTKSDFSGNPASVILSSPPIRSQGDYGTCVAFSVGYYFRTMNRANYLDWTGSLDDTAFQYSPKDLWYSIPTTQKGDGCGGTYLTAAFDQLVERGIASWKTVPYENIICSSLPKASWSAEAQDYRLQSYRVLNLATTNDIIDKMKAILADGKPIAMASVLKESFSDWDSDAVVTEMTGRELGGHAMTVIGFDNVRNAFRVQNSWGLGWADQGGIWVDQEYFVDGFAYEYVVIAYEIGEDGGPSAVSKGADGLQSAGILSAEDTSAGARITYFTVALDEDGQGGQVSFTAESGSSYAFFYYNAADALDSGIVAEGDIRAGATAFSYVLPSTLNGEYYLCLAVDKSDLRFVIDEQGLPLSISNGSSADRFIAAESAVTDAATNAYTADEIRWLLNGKGVI